MEYRAVHDAIGASRFVRICSVNSIRNALAPIAKKPGRSRSHGQDYRGSCAHHRINPHIFKRRSHIELKKYNAGYFSATMNQLYTPSCNRPFQTLARTQTTHKCRAVTRPAVQCSHMAPRFDIVQASKVPCEIVHVAHHQIM